jgi:hypothetical protein
MFRQAWRYVLGVIVGILDDWLGDGPIVDEDNLNRMLSSCDGDKGGA